MTFNVRHFSRFAGVEVVHRNRSPRRPRAPELGKGGLAKASRIQPSDIFVASHKGLFVRQSGLVIVVTLHHTPEQNCDGYLERPKK